MTEEVINQVASIFELTQRPHEWSQEALSVKLPYYPNYEVREHLKGKKDDPNCPLKYNHQSWTWDSSKPDDRRIKDFLGFCSSLQWGVDIYDAIHLPQKEGNNGAMWSRNLSGVRIQYSLNYKWYFDNLTLMLSDRIEWSKYCHHIIQANGRGRKDYIAFSETLLKLYEEITKNKVCIIPSDCQVKKEDIDAYLEYIRNNV